MVIVFVLVGVAALAVLGGFHWYAWRRLVRDTTAGPGTARRVGAALFVAGPLLMLAAVVSERAGAPFWLQRTLGWPGFLWMALALYLLLALLVGELVRPLLRRALDHRAATRRTAGTEAVADSGTDSGAEAVAHGTTVGVHRTPGVPASTEPAPKEPSAAKHTEPAAPGEPGQPGEPRGSGEPLGTAAPVDGPLAAPSRRLFVSPVVGGAVAPPPVGTLG
jgi:hypothetical protein